MKIKRFFAPDMRQAIKQVRETFGPDAVILSNKSVDGGVELVAARDYDENALASAPEDRLDETSTGWDSQPQQPAAPAPEELPGQVATLARRLREQAQVRNPMAGPPRQRNEGRAVAVAEEEAALQEMRREMAALRRMMETELSELSWHNMERQRPQRKELLRKLMELDLHPELCRVLADEVDDGQQPEAAFRHALANLARRLPESDTDFLEQGGAVALIGPTGVGKTTTVAKLAARFCLRYGNRQLALITTDNFRIGAEEQLHTYGRILDVPVRTVNDEKSLNAALNQFSERRLVLIDTAGMSQRDVRLGQQIGLLKRGNRPIHTLLTLAATTQQAALEHAIEAFSPARPSACVVTKIDEACSLGGLISTLSHHQLAMSFSADGQKVPEDIHIGRPHTLVSRAVELSRRGGGIEIGDDLLAMRMGGAREHAHV